MARKVETLFVDDIDGGGADGTVRFALDGTAYEIDLSTVHSEELRKVLAPYVGHARRVGGAARRVPGGRVPGGRAAAQALDTHKVREWARENGFAVKERGRVPADVVARYKAATGA